MSPLAKLLLPIIPVLSGTFPRIEDILLKWSGAVLGHQVVDVVTMTDLTRVASTEDWLLASFPELKSEETRPLAPEYLPIDVSNGLFGLNIDTSLYG